METLALTNSYYCKLNKWHTIAAIILFIQMILFPLSINASDNLIKKNNSVPMVRIQLKGLPNYLDECVVYYQDGATNGFDTEYDAYKVFGSSSAPQISIEYNSLLMVINGIPPVTQTYTTNIRTTAAISGNYTITASDMNFLPEGTCVLLTDLATNFTTNLATNSYSFVLQNTTTASRFVLTITHNSLPIVSQLSQPSCQINSGKIIASGSDLAPWNYIWRDSLNQIIKTSLNKTTPDSINNLNKGIFNLEITSTNNNCYRNKVSFKINPVVIPDVSFSSLDTLVASISQNFNPINSSSNCQDYYWDFGNNNFSHEFEPSYSYSLAGQYNVKISGISSTGCVDSATKTITVINLTTNTISYEKNQITVNNLGNNNYSIILNGKISAPLNVFLFNGEGKLVFNEIKENITPNTTTTINLSNYTRGIYLLSINCSGNNLSTTKVIVQ